MDDIAMDNKSTVNPISGKGLMLKIVENRYLNDILSGKLYFSPLNYFKTLEKNSGDQVIGDKREGMISGLLKNSDLYFKLNNSNEIIKDDRDDVRINFDSDETENIGICCFIFLGEDDFAFYKAEGDKKLFELSAPVIDEIEHFKREKEVSTGQECSFIVFGGQAFARAIDAEEHGKVQYYDEKKPSEVMEAEESLVPNYFYKSTRYSKQREYRVATFLSNKDCGEVKDFPELKQKSKRINDLKEIVIVVENKRSDNVGNSLL